MPPPEDAIRRRRRRIASVIALILVAWPVLCPVPPPVHLASTLRDDDYVGFLVSLYEASRRSDRAYYKYHLDDLPIPEESLWACIQINGRDEAYMNFLGLDKGNFLVLLEAYKPIFEESLNLGRTRRGRPQTISPRDSLAMVLVYLRDGASQKQLQGNFGFSQTAVSRGLRIAMKVLPRALLTFEGARVIWPTQEKMAEYAALIEQRHSDLKGTKTFAFVDGLNVPIKEPSDACEQNAYYNGWLAGTYCSSVLVFGPDGRILWVYGNSPGNCHDSTIAEPLYCLLMDTCASDDGPFRIAADSAFKNAGDLRHYIFKPLKSDALARMANDADVSVDELAGRITQHRSCVSVRQAAEWGMGSLQKDFRILRGPLPADAAERRQILDAVVLLHNFRCVVARCPNQIRTTFTPGHLTPLEPRAGLTVERAMFGVENASAAAVQAIAERVRREGGVILADE